MIFKNLTPHELSIYTVSADGSLAQVATLKSEGFARAAQITTPDGNVEIDGVKVPVSTTSFGLADVPEPQEGVAFVVSAITANAPNVRGRADVFCPGVAVRKDETTGQLSSHPSTKGAQVGCVGLYRV